MRFIDSIFIFLLFLVLTSCQTSQIENGKEIVNALEFTSTIEVSKTYNFTDQVNIFNPFRILNVNEDYIVVSELKQDDFFHLFSLPNLKYLYSSGENGRGPNEFIAPPTYIEVNKKGLEVYDPLLETLRFFSIGDSSLVEWKKISLGYNNQIEPLNRPIRINDSTYYADYGTSVEETNSEYIALRPGEEDSLFTFGKYPSSDLEKFDRYSHFLKTNISRSNDDRFATFYIYHNRFKIFGRKGKKLKDISINDPFVQENSSDFGEYIYRITSCSSNDYIYLLGVYASGKRVYDNPNANLKTSIEVWTWEGRPVYRAKFDRLIHGFTVSEKFKKIYGFSLLNDSTIFEYNLDKSSFK